MARWFQLIVVALGALGGCRQLFGLEAPDQVERAPDASVDAPPPCLMDIDCPSEAPYCELGANFCVECLMNTHCDAATPRCHPDAFTCVGCVTHADCQSEVCLPTGACADPDDVAYVDPAAVAGSTTCSLSAKCTQVTTALNLNRAYVKLSGMLTTGIDITSRTVVIFADPGASVSSSNLGPVLDIRQNSEVTIYGLSVRVGQDFGIRAESNSTLRLVEVTVSGGTDANQVAIYIRNNSSFMMSRSTIAENAGGALLVDATSRFDITNSFIVANGGSNTDEGAVTLEATAAGTNRFEYNTVVDNGMKSVSGRAAGVTCLAPGLAIPNNIIARNTVNGSASAANANILGAGSQCDTSGSTIATDVVALRFIAPDPPTRDYHLQATSSALDAAAASNVSVDFDGDLRPQGGAADRGADEYKAP